MTNKTISVKEFNERRVEANKTLNCSVYSHPIMQEDVQPIVRDDKRLEAAAAVVGDAITYASTSPSATDVVRMMLYLITSYPIAPYPKHSAEGMFATDGIRIFINPAAVEACQRMRLYLSWFMNLDTLC